ncbi:MAG: hypothetical protein ACRDZQ_07665 [Acidimicrobiales bacterium]
MALVDDHLLRDLLADALSAHLVRILHDHEPATTNMYLYRLCKSVASARGGTLTGSWPLEQRQELGRRLVTIPETIKIVPVRLLAYRMAEIAHGHRVSTLGAEAVAAAEHLLAPLYVWEGDDGPGIRSAVEAQGGQYHTVVR